MVDGRERNAQVVLYAVLVAETTASMGRLAINSRQLAVQCTGAKATLARKPAAWSKPARLKREGSSSTTTGLGRGAPST